MPWNAAAPCNNTNILLLVDYTGFEPMFATAGRRPKPLDE